MLQTQQQVAEPKDAPAHVASFIFPSYKQCVIGFSQVPKKVASCLTFSLVRPMQISEHDTVLLMIG
jgi:hypothetical protein